MTDPSDTPPAGGSAAPGIDQSVRELGTAGRATLDSARATGRALRTLISADLALARSSLGRGLAWVAMAIVFGASAWLLITGVLVALLQGVMGLSWLLSLVLVAVLNLAVTALAVWRTSHYFDSASMHATRRQLAQLGIGDEDGEDDSSGDAP